MYCMPQCCSDRILECPIEHWSTWISIANQSSKPLTWMKWYAAVVVSDLEIAMARSKIVTIVIASPPHTPIDNNIIVV